MSQVQIHFIEELAANAWPAAIVQVVDGWRLRFNWGVTSRANSVYPNGWDDDNTLDEKLRMVDEFYARWGARPVYQISPAAQPADLDGVLAAHGYTSACLTNVQVADIMVAGNLLSSSAVRSTASRVSLPAAVSITPDLTDEWLATYCGAAELSGHKRAMRQGIMQRIGPRAGFALAHMDGQPAAVGLGVCERGWTGVFCMETAPACRRQGAATAILAALAQWGQSHGAANLYLQVVADNTPALSLYARAGFHTLYQYHYREAPQPERAL